MEQEHNMMPENEVQKPETLTENAVNETVNAQENESAKVENEKEQVEIPPIDFTNLSTADIVRQMQKLIEQYPVSALKEVMERLPEIFENKYKQEYEAALALFTADGDLPENFEYKNNSKEEFNNLYKLYKDKKNSVNRQLEAEREENLKIKLGIIEDLKALMQKEESMGKTFQEFRELQERWRNTGMVPQNQVNNLWETFHHHVENFYNYIKINKELRDLDLKRNLDAKTALCEEAEKLSEMNDIAGSFKQLQTLHSQWKEIGPIPKEQKDALWERFKQASNTINEKYHKFFETLKEEQENNLKIKEDICEKIDQLANGDYQTMAQWQSATEKIIALQQEWKQAGNVPQKDRNKIYKKFRGICDKFFDRKREFHKQWEVEAEKNLQLKLQLCEKAEALQNSTDWKSTTNQIIALQKEWKKIGPTAKKYSNKVWNRFRAACDVFFNNKSMHFKDKDAEQMKNLELKKALIEEAKQFTLSGNNEEDIEKLKEFQTRWNQIGFVPIKEKENIQEEFRAIIDQWFDQLDLDEFDRSLERFRAKISTLDADENKEYKIINEREKLVTKIRQLETDIHTWENNIGFINKSNKSESLLHELNLKIEKTKQRLALLQEKLKALDAII